ncbi:putative nucleotidyltransferase substrate binding domain-containing protein [Geomesophilobacter sediminis]|uniref:Nucleotidyltransferase n=1 Tax=Geomesophilobacter sediminis TaxID=2798584 RepID=A0A8J7JDE9_9BACT|nr:putative nucleotidyltransferase substrate binding domain-containing protein [Geomesophilobacter sediminis]MBJ6725123.1 nucleotidyltransferase [Geomesophilobacter sediminis]
MPHTLYPPHPISEPELLEKLLGEVRSFLPLLQRSEMQQLLQALRDNAQEELDQIEAFARREQALRASIPATDDYAKLLRIHEDLNALEMDRFLRYHSVTALHQNCTAYRDELARRAVELVTAEISSPPPLPFALVSMGSDGREEQTLITDQDYLVVYQDGGEQAADQWFREFSELLVERMEAIGFKKCTGGIMPSFENWRGSLQQWQRRLLGIVRYETTDYGKNLMDLIVLSDARYVAGDRETAESLVELIRSLEMDYFQALWGMAKAATEMKLALGFLKRFWTEGSGEHKGEFNLKLLAWAPLVMNVRILAMNQGIPATATVRRIELLQAEGSLSGQMAAGLIEAYRVLTKHRILLQIKVIKGIQKDAYHVNPHTLPKEEREQIRRALLLIEELQKVIHTNFSIM